MTLFDLQKKFSDALNLKNENILDCISSKKLTKKEHFAIYEESIKATLQNTLAEIFPVCAQLVGSPFFTHMTNEYISQTPSKFYDLAHYGENFSLFIAHFKPAQVLAYLSDVAKLEWALHITTFSKPLPEFDLSSLSPDISFSLPNNSFLLTSHYPIHLIWEMHQKDHMDQRIIIEDKQIYYFLVWQKKLNSRIEVLKKIEWDILQLVKNHLPLSEIISNIAFENIDPAIIIPNMIYKGWLQNYL